jgi:hypothetical protein
MLCVSEIVGPHIGVNSCWPSGLGMKKLFPGRFLKIPDSLLSYTILKMDVDPTEVFD